MDTSSDVVIGTFRWWLLIGRHCTCLLSLKRLSKKLSYLLSCRIRTLPLFVILLPVAAFWLDLHCGQNHILAPVSGWICKRWWREPTNSTDFSSFIPSIHSEPIRFLGRIIDGSISDRKAIDELEKKLLDGLTILDKSCFKGPQKLWIMQHFLIPRIQWSLLIYEVPISVAVRLEQKTSSFIRKWLNLHHSTTNICFYSSSSPCPLPIKSLTSIFKSCKISGLLLLRDSKDPLVSGNRPNLKSGSWNANWAVRSAESELNFRKLRGPTQFGRAGIGTTSHKPIPNDKHSHEYRKLISKTSKEIDEESQLARALQLQVQCQWTR